MNIQAVTSKPAFNIEAALANPAIKANARLLASIGIEKPTAKISMHELETKMAAANLPAQKRIELKIALDRAGLMAA
jgi:hypothetical protein